MSFLKKFFPNKKRNSLNPNDFVHIEDEKPSTTNNDNTNANNNKRNTISSPPVHNYPQPSVIHVAPSSPSHIPSNIEHDQPSQPIISSNPLPPPKPVYMSTIQRNKGTIEHQTPLHIVKLHPRNSPNLHYFYSILSLLLPKYVRPKHIHQTR